MTQQIVSETLPHLDRLPTMYDLPSDDPLEPGLPDEFHGLQPQLLAETLHLTEYDESEMFCAFDLNLYYDPNYRNWYKRPDWFLAVGVSRLYQGQVSRSSYVTWDERVNPVVVIEFLSPGTESEDLGPFFHRNVTLPTASLQSGKPPNKFTVYEQILQIPNYFVFNKNNQQLRYFRLVNGRYVEQAIAQQKPLFWIPEIQLGLGLWQGAFRGLSQTWLRWCYEDGKWCLTETEFEREAKEQERRAKEQAELREQEAKRAQAQERVLREKLEEYLRSQGIDPNNLPG